MIETWNEHHEQLQFPSVICAVTYGMYTPWSAAAWSRGAPETLQLFFTPSNWPIAGLSKVPTLVVIFFVLHILCISRCLFKDTHQIVRDGMLSTRKPFLCFDVQLLGIWGSVLM